MKTTSTKQKTWMGICFLFITILLLLILSYFVGIPLIKTVKDPLEFRKWVSQNSVLSPLFFIGITILQVLLAFIPGEPFEIAAGYAFGAIEGTLLCIIASTLGSMLVFFLVKRFGIKLVQVFFSKEKIHSLKFLKQSKKRDILFLIIFMIPGTPKDLLSYVAGLTNINYFTWFIICLFGRIPSIITSTIGGNFLGNQHYLGAILVFAVTFLISLIGILIYNKICNQQNNKSDEVL